MENIYRIREFDNGTFCLEGNCEVKIKGVKTKSITELDPKNAEHKFLIERESINGLDMQRKNKEIEFREKGEARWKRTPVTKLLEDAAVESKE